jgi:hypothetical protein
MARAGIPARAVFILGEFGSNGQALPLAHFRNSAAMSATAAS